MSGRLMQVQDWAALMWQKDFVIEKVAGACRVSRKSLERHFAEIKGYTPQEFAHRTREEASERLLREGLYVRVVAEKLRFRSASHFCHWFRTRYGVTPQVWLARALAAEGRKDQPKDAERLALPCD